MLTLLGVKKGLLRPKIGHFLGIKAMISMGWLGPTPTDHGLYFWLSVLTFQL
jgi:hypothetical protein